MTNWFLNLVNVLLTDSNYIAASNAHQFHDPAFYTEPNSKTRYFTKISDIAFQWYNEVS